MPIPAGLHNEPPQVRPGQHLGSQSPPERVGLPAHPRQVLRAAEAYQAVFAALSRLLPLQSGGGRSVGGGGVGGRTDLMGEIGRMQAAAVRCGEQCQGYIRALQKGIEVRSLSKRSICS